ncbi:MAG: ATP-binding protein [Rhodovibrionaceae bacterium]|nr:ATP-binding protein [Rhodovibrionaceae bacterium]
MRITLLLKLLAVNLPVIVAAMAVVWFAVDILGANYFSTLMEQYGINPDDTHRMFIESIHRYLLQASVAAVVIAVLLSFLLTRRVLKPLAAMQQATRRLARGDYTARAEPASRDELGDLAEAFNQMAAGLERGERLRRAMVADVAHELRTPLTNLRGYLEAIADGVIEPDRETLDMLQAEILRLVRLVDDLHNLSQAEIADATLKRERLDLPRIVEAALALERPVLDRAGVAVEVEIPDNAKRLMADEDKLAQVLGNLVRNARQYTPANGHIRIAAARAGGRTKITVGNSDPVEALEDLPHIFERFYRVDKSRSRASGGAGIGLAIVKSLVEAHGGRVAAQSRDGWTEVSIELPD